MYCSAKKAIVVTVDLSQNESTSAKITAETLRGLNNLIVGMTHGQSNLEDFFFINGFDLIEFLADLSDNHERAEKKLAEYLNTFKDEGN